MKEFTFKIKQLLMGTRVIENQLKYKILCTVCAIIHCVFMVTLYIGGIYPLAALNVMTTLLYAVGGYILASNEKYRAMFIISFFEIEINSAISSILLGSGYDFMVYTLSLIPGAFYMAHTWPAESKNKYGYSYIPIVSTLIIGMMYVVVEFLYSVVPPFFVVNTPNVKSVLHYFNIFIAVLLLLTFSMLFAFEVRYILNLVNDENSRLGEIASKDPLTKALNRRSLTDIINREIADNVKSNFGLIILDIDDFKKVNDTYGHNVGDQVLIGVASIMQNSIRENDYLCRWGGEEFLLMIHGTEDEYGIVAERIRESIGKQEFTTDAHKFSVTATLGIAEYQTGLNLRTLVDMADQKLYYGKNHGKNQVVR